MKKQFKLSPAIAEMVALCYQAMSSAREYARGIASDPMAPGQVRNDFHHVASSLTIPIERIENRIPASIWETFKIQVKDNDSIRLDNIKALYVRMLPAQQEMVELFMEGLLRGDLIEFETANNG